MQWKTYPTEASQVKRKVEDMLERIKRVEKNVSERRNPVRKPQEEKSEFECIVDTVMREFRKKLSSQKELSGFRVSYQSSKYNMADYKVRV